MTAAPDTGDRFSGAATEGELAVLLALLGGPVSRERVDQLAKASNGPDVILHLRERGLPARNCLRCHRERIPTPSGDRWRGIYTLTSEGRRRVREWLQRRAAATPHP